MQSPFGLCHAGLDILTLVAIYFTGYLDIVPKARPMGGSDDASKMSPTLSFSWSYDSKAAPDPTISVTREVLRCYVHNPPESVNDNAIRAFSVQAYSSARASWKNLGPQRKFW